MIDIEGFCAPKALYYHRIFHITCSTHLVGSTTFHFCAQKYLAVGNSMLSSFKLNDSLFDFLIAAKLDPNPLSLELKSPRVSSLKLFNSSPFMLFLLSPPSFSGIVTLVTSLTIISATCQASSSFIFSFSSLVTKFFTTLPNRDVFFVP